MMLPKEETVSNTDTEKVGAKAHLIDDTMHLLFLNTLHILFEIA